MAEPLVKKPKLVLGVRYRERKNDPPPGLEWRKVKDKETLGSIADEYNIRAIDLMLYNWHTVDPLEVNWYLKNFMGCRQNNGKWYSFSWADNPGQILVPNIPPALKKGPPKSVNATRNGKSTLDNKLQVHVQEWLANGMRMEVTDQWLYVFSGKAGINFGSPQDFGKSLGKDAPPEEQPGSAFTLDFPGVCRIKERPDKLEYEIYISGHKELSGTVRDTVAGLNGQTKPHYKLGGHWHFLSDPQILAKAQTESRDKRTTHAFRSSKAVTIDLSQNLRYYFLLSPVQLGSEAIKYAMSNPAGLTPLLKPGDDKRAWDPTGGMNPYKPRIQGPTADDIQTGTFILPVINPYSWAENIAEVIFPDAVKQLTKWVKSSQNETVEELKKETGWLTLDHFYLGQILDSVTTNYPDRDDILDEFKDWRKWHENLRRWEQKLVQRNAEITASAHRSLIQLIEWLNGPSHAIIDTAILLDTFAKLPEDAVDVSQGILHWSLCLENIMTLEPGGVYLKQVLTAPDSVPVKMLFQHLDKARHSAIPQMQQIAFRFAYPGLMKLLALRNFVAEPPSPHNLTRNEYQKKIAEENLKRRDELIKLQKENKILPATVAPLSLPGLQSGDVDFKLWSSGLYGILDISDKLSTYVIDKNVNFDEKSKSRIIQRLRRTEVWFDGKPKWFTNGINYGTNFAVKGVAIVVSGYNLITAITTARYDYQKEQSTVSTLDYINVSAGAMIAVQDVLSTVSAILDKDKKRLARIFPELTRPGGKFVVTNQITGIVGKSFASLNVMAMFAAGVTTMISMGKSTRNSASRGDYTASGFYFGGAVGGAMMATGAVVLGVVLMKAGGAAAATGIGATVGVLLFSIGGIIVAITSIFAWLFTSDNLEVFVRKCFFGKEGDKEPRFGLNTISSTIIDDPDPPDWSHALKTGKKTWTIDKQKRAIHNLLGQFSVRTRLDKSNDYRTRLKNSEIGGTLAIEIYPGLLIEGCTIEVALHYGKSGDQTSEKVRWWGENKYSLEPGIKGDLFGDINPYFDIKTYQGHKNTITIFAHNLKYEPKKGKLLTTVTLRYPDLSNVIRCRKLVLEPDGSDYTRVNENQETSALFV